MSSYKTAITFILFITFITSCNKLIEKHYNSSDTNIQLVLNADKTLSLMYISQHKAEDTLLPDTLITSGTWETYDNQVRCTIRESEEFISDAFFKSGFKEKEIKQSYNQIIFPVTTDTIYIYGQPCIAEKS